MKIKFFLLSILAIMDFAGSGQAAFAEGPRFVFGGTYWKKDQSKIPTYPKPAFVPKNTNFLGLDSLNNQEPTATPVDLGAQNNPVQASTYKPEFGAPVSLPQEREPLSASLVPAPGPLLSLNKVNPKSQITHSTGRSKQAIRSIQVQALLKESNHPAERKVIAPQVATYSKGYEQATLTPASTSNQNQFKSKSEVRGKIIQPE